MEKEIRQVVSTGGHSEELTVQHVGKPGQGMPDTHEPGGESPGEAIPGEPTRDDGIAANESQIVEDKLMGPHLFKDYHGKQDER